MKAAINNTLISKLTPQNNRYDVWDTKLAGFHVRVFPSAKKTYRCLYKRGKIVTIGSTELLTTTQAREKAKAILGDTAKGITPLLGSTKNKHPALRQYLADEYAKWRQTNRKNGLKDIDRLRLHFIDDFGDTQLSNITQLDIEHWRSNRLKSGIKPATINRDINILKAALSKAVEWDIIETHPLAKLKSLQVDNATKIRFLSIDEENRLRQAIDNREHRLQVHRDSANKWRKDRKYKELPNDAHDHIKPMILLSINTGVRQGELFELTWENIDLQHAVVTIIGTTAKSCELAP